MAVVACELIVSPARTDKWIGSVCLAIVVAKTIYELITGHAFFSSLHLGNIGIPIVECHAGGIIGGILLFLTFHLHQIKKSSHPINPRIRIDDSGYQLLIKRHTA
jgi:hypothetical protein